VVPFGGRVAVHYVLPAQVGELGTWTAKVLITETPTILMIQPNKALSAVAGFTDERSIEQTLDGLLGFRSTPVIKAPQRRPAAPARGAAHHH
jgi:hypothetical protein